MFIDEITIHAEAGKGGDGVVRWLHEKGKEYGGPAGGDGGKGGDVYAEAVSDIGILAKYRNIKEFKAERGEEGKNFSRSGADGKDVTILLPVGSLIHNGLTGEVHELVSVGDRVKILAGGKGGLGNERFKSSRKTRPDERTLGEKGEEADFKIELRLIADVGLVGFPNAGKSSLLNSLTRAQAKVGDYAFTTLEPNLGVMGGIIIADIPGLIEGAAEGKGLGHAFLRHIQRTRLLLYCIASDTEDVATTFLTLKKELHKYDKELGDRPTLILITKSDLSDSAPLKVKKKALSEATKINEKDILVGSILDDHSLELLKKVLEKAVK